MQETKIDFAKLLGFATLEKVLETGIDFQDETLSDKLGAKIGPPEIITPEK
jgi:hypothetical protein